MIRSFLLMVLLAWASLHSADVVREIAFVGLPDGLDSRVFTDRFVLKIGAAANNEYLVFDPNFTAAKLRRLGYLDATATGKLIPADNGVKLEITVNAGKLFHIRTVTIDGREAAEVEKIRLEILPQAGPYPCSEEIVQKFVSHLAVKFPGHEYVVESQNSGRSSLKILAGGWQGRD